MWLKKLDKLTYQRATRSFFSELKSRKKNREGFGSIEKKKGDISRILNECLSNWEELYSELYKELKKFDFDFSRYPTPPKIDTGFEGIEQEDCG